MDQFAGHPVDDARTQEIDTIEGELIGLIGKWDGGRHPITSQSALYQDLHIVGDDLYELFVEITKRYGTSFEGFRFDIYVPDESTALWYYCAMRLGFCRNSFPRFTVAHLAAVIHRGLWFEPTLNQRGRE
jgi:hypothetical protein